MVRYEIKERKSMALAVYSRVGSMLQAAGMDLDEVRVLVAARYGVTLDRAALVALTQDGRVQRPDIEVLEAVAMILRVPVDDLLQVRALGPAAVSDDVLLDLRRDTRLRELVALRDQGDRPLTEEEVRDLEMLLAQAGRALVERDLALTAERLSLPLEVVRDRITTHTAEATRFWAELGADPARMAAEVEEARARRQARTG